MRSHVPALLYTVTVMTDAGQCEAPDWLFTTMGLGTAHSCAIRLDGELRCWGCAEDPGAGPCQHQDDLLADVAGGDAHTCAVTTDGDALCWGDDTYGQSQVEGGTMARISAGPWHTCGLQTNGYLACWGCTGITDGGAGDPTDHGQCGTYAETCIAIAAGTAHSCAIRDNGTLRCWGCEGSIDGTPADHGQCDPPDSVDGVTTTTFTEVAAGRFHSCAITTDADLLCWGDDSAGQASPPDLERRGARP